MSPQRIQRKRTKGWRMPEGAVYVGRPTKWGNPFEYLTPQGVIRYRPEAPEEWEYHPYYGPDWTVTDYRVRYATRGELVRMYRRTILDPDRGMLGAYPSNGGHLLTYWTGPQWSPVVTTGTTRRRGTAVRARAMPQWSPVVTTGTTLSAYPQVMYLLPPQWSPVVTTGTTRRTHGCCRATPGRNGAPS